MVPSPVNMALPLVKSVHECADFDITVLPFVKQLYDFPQRLLGATSQEALKQFYLTTNPVVTAIAFSLFIAQAPCRRWMIGSIH